MGKAGIRSFKGESVNSGLETVMDCPLCGREITMGLERDCGITDIAAILLEEYDKHENYMAEAKCPACGAKVMARLAVTAMKAARK
jgi:predicted RNA-binding Zn-ribbon protein involved in translation (DUF1610 family)